MTRRDDVHEQIETSITEPQMTATERDEVLAGLGGTPMEADWLEIFEADGAAAGVTTTLSGWLDHYETMWHEYLLNLETPVARPSEGEADDGLAHCRECRRTAVARPTREGQ
jgi:hypothetical protein